MTNHINHQVKRNIGDSDLVIGDFLSIFLNLSLIPIALFCTHCHHSLTMKKSLFATLAFSTVLLAGCVDTTGISSESKRPVQGNPDSGIVLMEFADLQCPACRSAHTLVTKPILEKYGDRIVFVFKHFPLQSIHRFAMEAAEASECAADQGKFWEFLDVNYLKQDEMSSAAFRTWAEELGLDTDLFDRCMKSHIKRKSVVSDYEEGQAGGVNSTPTYFVNGVKVPNNVDAISKALDAAIEGGNVPL